MEEQEKNIIHGKANWEIIKQVKDSIKIPVIGNGDIKSKEDALKCLKETGADGLMIGRAALGNPQIFSEILSKTPNITKKEALLKISKILRKNYCDGFVLGQLRAHLVHFIKSEKTATKAKVALLKIENLDELEAEIVKFYNQI